MNSVKLGVPPFFLREGDTYTLNGPLPDQFFNTFCTMSIKDRIVLERTAAHVWKVTVPSTSKCSWRWP